MDATKNAAITVLNTLTPNDRVAVVVFSNNAFALGTKAAESIVSKKYDQVKELNIK